MWCEAQNYDVLVEHAWDIDVIRTKMYKVVQKLKSVKKAVRELNQTGFHGLGFQLQAARKKFDEC